MNIENLNNFAQEFLTDENLRKFTPIQIIKDESITLVPKDVDAFQLNPLVGSIKFVHPENKNSGAAITRSSIGYTEATKMSEDKDYFKYFMSLVVNNHLVVLTKTMGYLNFRKLTCFRPGTNKEVFRWCSTEESESIEFRIFLYEEKENE